MQRRCQLVDERDLLTVKPDDPKRSHLEEERLRCHDRCRSDDLHGRIAVSRKEEKQGIISHFREEEGEVAMKIEEMVEMARVELAFS